MSQLNHEIEEVLDFTHCESILEAQSRLSRITNLLNKLIKPTRDAKKELLLECTKYEGLEKLGADSRWMRLIRLAQDSPDYEKIIENYSVMVEGEIAIERLKHKQRAVLEDLMALKKIADIQPKQ